MVWLRASPAIYRSQKPVEKLVPTLSSMRGQIAVCLHSMSSSQCSFVNMVLMMRASVFTMVVIRTPTQLNEPEMGWCAYLNDDITHPRVVLWMQESCVLVDAEFIVKVHIGSVPAALVISLHLNILRLAFGVSGDLWTMQSIKVLFYKSKQS